MTETKRQVSVETKRSNSDRLDPPSQSTSDEPPSNDQPAQAKAGSGNAAKKKKQDVKHHELKNNSSSGPKKPTKKGPTAKAKTTKEKDKEDVRSEEDLNSRISDITTPTEPLERERESNEEISVHGSDERERISTKSDRALTTQKTLSHGKLDPLPSNGEEKAKGKPDEARPSDQTTINAEEECKDLPLMETAEHEQEHKTGVVDALDFIEGVIIFVIVAVPGVATVAGLSWIGYGAEVFNAVAPPEMDLIGSLLIIALVAFLLFGFVVDILKARRIVLTVYVVLAYVLVLSAIVLKGITYSWSTVLLTLSFGPALVMDYRGFHKFMRRGTFYYCVAMSMITVGIAGIVVWFMALSSSELYESEYGIVWTNSTKLQITQETSVIYEHVYKKRPLSYRVCKDTASFDATESDGDFSARSGSSSDMTNRSIMAAFDDVAEDVMDGAATAVSSRKVHDALSSQEATAINVACGNVETVQYVVWSSPLVMIIFNFVVAIFCLYQGTLNLDTDAGLVKLIRMMACIFVFILAGLFMIGYLYGNSTQLARAFVVFCVLTSVGLVLFLYHEVRMTVFIELSERSMFAKYVVKAYRSNWTRALAVPFWSVAILVYVVLDMIRWSVRKTRGTAAVTVAKDDPIKEHLRTWKWADILSKICLLGIIGTVLILGGKCTFILFSWLNVKLEPFSIAIVIVLVFFTGIVMFMLPPVPGSAVYLFAGIVVGKPANELFGIWLSAVIASLTGLSAKLLGSLGQYSIGFIAGKDVRVQKFVGVDSVPTRAIEKILKAGGLGLGKMAILVGGPDWPTSVTCGILKMSVPMMLLGTLPVYVVSIFPQTLVGCMLVLDTSEDKEFWDMLNSVLTGFAAAAQAMASLIAAFYITKTIERDGEELAKPRPEHQQVADLSSKQARFQEEYDKVTDWHGSHMTLRRKGTILVAASLTCVVGVLFALDFALEEPIVFRSFAITNSITDPHELGGLNGSALNIVIFPMGVIALALFVVAVMIFKVFTAEMGRLAAKRSKLCKE